MNARRITFGDLDASEAFAVPTVGQARISLAWWEPGQPDPVVVLGRRGMPATVVIVWPTDARGMLVRGQLEQGLWRALPWHLDQPTFARLRDLHRAWPLERHDLVVGAAGLHPRAETLRAWPGLRAEVAVQGAIHALGAA